MEEGDRVGGDMKGQGWERRGRLENWPNAGQERDGEETRGSTVQSKAEDPYKGNTHCRRDW